MLDLLEKWVLRDLQVLRENLVYKASQVQREMLDLQAVLELLGSQGSGETQEERDFLERTEKRERQAYPGPQGRWVVQDSWALRVIKDKWGPQEKSEAEVLQDKRGKAVPRAPEELEVLWAIKVNQDCRGCQDLKEKRVMWVHQDQEVPLDNKGPQVSQVTRVNKDLKEREDLKDFQAYLGRKARKDTMEQRALQETLEKLGHQGNEDFLVNKGYLVNLEFKVKEVTEEHKGEHGVQGLTGFQGFPGPKGPEGDAGIAGISGPKGPTGRRGSTGPLGREGITGPTEYTTKDHPGYLRRKGQTDPEAKKASEVKLVPKDHGVNQGLRVHLEHQAQE
ncbi:hypothetical protein CB1_001326006 [Camelus ferus]|nr:hypothetical protein CB1_001326006 [Camelus ferus]